MSPTLSQPSPCSMTGFARTDGHFGPVRWHWEVRSVNGRGLDVRMRLASGYEAIEQRARDAVQRHFSRGNISLTLNAQRSTGDTEIRLNEAALGQVVKAATRVRELTGAPAPTVEGLLQVRGVLEIVEPSDEDASALHTAILASLQAALDGVVASRRQEGQRLAQVVADQLGLIARLTEEAAASPARRPEAIRKRLEEQIARLVDARTTLDPDRLHQEAVMLAQRADIEEELKRLTSHIAAASDLLRSPAAAGRRLDFISQEFNREANTLCAKSNDTEITRIGLELKTVIDQMREQVQNLE